VIITFRCASEDPKILSLQACEYNTLETSCCVPISSNLTKFQNITRCFHTHNKTKKKTLFKEPSVDKLTLFKIHKYSNNFNIPYGLLRAPRPRNFQKPAEMQASISGRSLFPLVQQNPHTDIGNADHTIMFSWQYSYDCTYPNYYNVEA